jgi:8-oxo-dGTP pyrophosphatase MutT (NUDIX family)
MTKSFITSLLLRRGVQHLFFVMEKLLIASPNHHEPVGSVIRHEAIAQKMWCLTTNIFVFNVEGKILCHQRSLNKERLPGYWMTHFGGHLCEGETFDSNAKKELFEETGILVDDHDMIPWGMIKLNTPRLWSRNYIVVINEQDHEIKPEPSEIQSVRWLSPDEIATTQGESWISGVADLVREIEIMKSVHNAVMHQRSILTPEKNQINVFAPITCVE